MFVNRRMTKNPVTIRPETPISEARYLMKKEKVHRFPVVNKDLKLVGVISEKDIINASPSPASTLDVYEMSYLLSKIKVDEVMTKKVISVTEDTPLEEAARIMVDNDIGGLPVVRDQTLVGIITESDIFKVLLEIFGARERAVRMTMTVPEQCGELAKLAGAIAEQGGNIVALGTFLGEDSTQSLLTVKVKDITPENLRLAVAPFVQTILDVREV